MNKFISLFIVTLSFIFVLVTEIKASDICEKEEKYSQAWYYNNCDGNILQSTDQKPIKSHLKKGKNNPWKGYPYNSGEIPKDANPNYKILKHYLKKYISYGKSDKSNYFKVTKNKNKIKEFEFNLKKDDFVIEQLNETALLSYLMYVNGEIVIDEISPKERFGKIFTNKTRYVSNSVGKSIISYITGHAICRGYVGDIHEPLDWDILENTLYENAKLIDVLNMASGIQDYYQDENFKNSNRWPNGHSVQSIMKKELKNTVAGKNKYFYANMNTNVVASYMVHKMGWKQYKKMLKEIFNDKVGIENHVVMHQPTNSTRSQHTLTYGMFLTRYDYLRVAVSMLDDWNNNTCEGKYLKSLYENRIDKGFRPKDNTKGMSNSNHYAGQFYVGISGKGDVPIFIMSGFGGQNIAIDFENKKITAIMAIHRNYDWMKLVHSKF